MLNAGGISAMLNFAPSLIGVPAAPSCGVGEGVESGAVGWSGCQWVCVVVFQDAHDIPAACFQWLQHSERSLYSQHGNTGGVSEILFRLLIVFQRLARPRAERNRL